MKKSLVLILIIIGGFSTNIFAQVTNEPIEIIERGLFNKKYYKKCGIEMTSMQMITLFKEDPNMEKHVKPLALNYAFETLFYSAGTILILWPVTESLYDEGDPNWTLAYIGAGCLVLSIPFQKAFDKRAAEAVKFYNSGYKDMSGFNLQLGPTGVGLVMKF